MSRVYVLVFLFEICSLYPFIVVNCEALTRFQFFLLDEEIKMRAHNHNKPMNAFASKRYNDE